MIDTSYNTETSTVWMVSKLHPSTRRAAEHVQKASKLLKQQAVSAMSHLKELNKKNIQIYAVWYPSKTWSIILVLEKSCLSPCWQKPHR